MLGLIRILRAAVCVCILLSIESYPYMCEALYLWVYGGATQGATLPWELWREALQAVANRSDLPLHYVANCDSSQSLLSR
jgi:hypothetical protein